MNEIDKIEKKPSFFAAFFKKGGYVGALFTAAAIALIIVGNYYLNLFHFFKSDKNLFPFTLITIGYSLLLLLFYAFISAKNGEFTFACQMGAGFMLAGVLFPLYVYFALDKFTLIRIAIAAGLFAFGLITTVITAVGYKKGERAFNGYFFATVKKFSFPAVILVAAIISCVTYLLAKPSFVVSLYARSKSANSINIPAYVFAGLTALTVISALPAKKIKIFDLFLLSASFSLPVVFLDVFFINGAAKSQLLIFAICGGADILLLLLRRFLFFKPDYNLPVQSGLKGFSKEYGLIAALTFGAGLALIMHVLETCGYIPDFLKMLPKRRTAAVTGYAPMIFAIVSFGLIAVSGYLLSVFSIKSKRAHIGDYILLSYAVAFLTGIPFAFLYGAGLIAKISLCASFAVSLALIIVRLTYKREQAKE